MSAIMGPIFKCDDCAGWYDYPPISRLEGINDVGMSLTESQDENGNMVPFRDSLCVECYKKRVVGVIRGLEGI